MQLLDGDLVLSPTDLAGFVACRHLTRLDLEVATGRRAAAPPPDEALQALFRRGLAHERAYLARLRAEGARVVEIAVDGHAPGRDALRAAEAGTLAAMASGADVVYQAALFDGRWRGHADLLLRRPDRPGHWGWSYDVADTKLAGRAGAAALLQLATYADRVADLQGIAPERLVVVTGDGARHAYPLDRCATYARGLRAELERFVADPPPTDPRPVPHCARCPWRPACRARWVDEDRLTLVARIRSAQVRELEGAGITTLTALAGADPEALPPRLGPAAHRLASQARLQLADRAGEPDVHRLLPAEPGRGLALLPPPSPGDVFFDIEGDPYVGDDGLEYLFGVVTAGGYSAFWATDPADERAAFEALVDRLTAAWRADPGMHVYHYAPYEPTRLRRLAGRYDTRVAEVGRLLRGRRLVDLYAVVTQGVQIGTESYSLKKLERHYRRNGREGAAVGDAMGSVVAFERWLAGGPGREGLLEGIRAYNEEDCRSTQALRDWLEGLRHEGGGDAVFGRPGPGDGAPPAGAGDRAASARAGLRAAEDAPVRLLGALLDWHRREALTVGEPPPAADPEPAGPEPTGPDPADPCAGEVAGAAFEARLVALAGWVAAHGVDAPLPDWRAARDLLLRRAVAHPGGPGAALAGPGEAAADAVARLAGTDGACGVLPVQGPPGTGTTGLAARIVVEALAAGRRVGVCAPHPSATGDLLRAIEARARHVGVPLPAGRARLIAGTDRTFVDPALHGALDLLVVDGAAGLPLAGAVAISGSARLLVLIGDPQQLNPPALGPHPAGAGVSALQHVLAGHATVPPERGVLLDTTYRLHPDLAALVSDLSYDGRVHGAPGLDRQRLESAGPLSGAGPRWVPVPAPPGADPDGGAGDAADRQAAVVAALVEGVLADGWRVDPEGHRHRVTPADVLVLTPYHRRALGLRRRLARGDLRVGTVEALQAARGAVVVLDLPVAADVTDPRGPGVGLDRNRLTVALSRASVLVALVGDPALLTAPARDPEGLMELDALCRYVAAARAVTAPG